jgi:hypothetical protein
MTAKPGELAVMVIYENTKAREAAVAFCDRLVEKFWAHAGFEVSWWSLALLAEAGPARQAAEKAVAADLIVFAAPPEGDLPLHVRAWIEGWLPQRGEREGALVGLIEGTTQAGELTDKHFYLRRLAHRLGMDYLTELPQSLSSSVADSPELDSARVHQVTSLLDDILRQPAAPSF